MKSVNIHQAKTHLSRLVEAAANGEEIVIAKAGKPMVRLVPVSRAERARALGPLAGSVRESEGWWAPDPEVEALFYGDEMRELKRRADRRGETLSAVVAEALRRGIAEPPVEALRPLPSHSMGPPLVDVADRDALYRAMEGS